MVIDWTTYTFIPLHKNGSSQAYSDYKTSAVISHPSKILLSDISLNGKFLRNKWDSLETKLKGTNHEYKTRRENSHNLRTCSKAFDCVNYRLRC